jgi:hypothetical protein
MKNLNEILEGKAPGHLYPFFWQKGQSLDVIRQYIHQMHEQGIRNFCVESRPHPEFLEEGWWKTMDVILEEAGKLDMHLWILDDDKFPTGHANGKVPADLKRHYLKAHCYDYVSDGSEIQLNVSCPAGMRSMGDPRHHSDQIVFCIAARKDTKQKNAIQEDTLVNVTDTYQDGLLSLQLPEGNWTVMVIYDTLCSEGRGVEDYLDMMNPEAVKVLIDEVYEKHYAHYADKFGTVIQGFFSDEPSFGNANGRQLVIGRAEMPLPWNESVRKGLLERGVQETETAYLFRGDSERAYQVSSLYMDTITCLYRDSFEKELHDWCSAHHVMYIGHVIEDDNVHARLGAGPGHYFRAIDGEDMAGIDIIGGQVVPGMDYHHDAFSTGGSDGEFYHYALARMGASAAKLDPKKQGRLMCEAFGAYGWVEGLKMMKWITDHMISHGGNWIVPHAFDPADFPDWDCPPHFYAHGKNPQYPYFHVWSHYADRLCHLFSNGVKDAQVGVLYHAFAEWNGETMMFQKPCKVLQQNQIDSDVISEDYLMQAVIHDGKYTINGCDYAMLVIPGCQRLPEALIEKINAIAKQVPVYIVGQKPEGLDAKTVSLEELPELAKDLTCVHVSSKQPHLNVYHYLQEDGQAWMFTNEDVLHAVDTEVTLTGSEELSIYDAFENRLYHLDASYGKDTVFHLHLDPYESLVLVSGSAEETKPVCGSVLETISDGFTISAKDYQEKGFHVLSETSTGDLSKAYSRFSGTLVYEKDLDLTDPEVMLRIPSAIETVQVECNGMDCGTRIAPDYVFDLSHAAKKGKNHLKITVVNTLERSQLDLFSMYLPIDGTGILKPVEVCKCE